MTPASRWDGHLVLLYRSEEEYDVSLAGWVRRGLDRGEKVVVTRLVGETEDRVLRLYADAGVDGAPQPRAQQVVWLPPAQFYPPQGQERLIAQALAEGFSCVRMSARASTALSIMSESGYLAAEQAMDRHCREGSMSALCAYHRPAPTEPLRDTLATHSGGVRAVGLNSSCEGTGVRLCGEVDLVTSDVLAAALVAAVATAADPHQLVLDLSRLDFIDVAGSRTLLRETADFRAAGGLLVLDRIQRPVARALRLMDLDRAPGVQLVEERP